MEMKLLKHFIVMCLVLGTFTKAVAQNRSRFFIKSNHFVLVLDAKSNKAEIDSLLRIANIPGLTSDMIISGSIPNIVGGWRIKKVKGGAVELNKPLTKNQPVTQLNHYLVTNNIVKTESSPGYPGDVLYGVNNFSKITVRELPSGITRFFFPGRTDVRRIQLSGSFNGWTTSKGLMTKTDSGWVSDIKLEPGPYAYKFIVNGQWIHDLNNKLTENDGHGNYNSIYYRYNYTFKLAGYNSAKRVILAGSFNNFNVSELVMTLQGSRLEKQLYLHEGTYLYRFMVDGRWITDPANANKSAKDGIMNSVLTLGEHITFKLNGFANAKDVCLSGSFNNWDPDMLHFQKTATGWVLPYTLPAGNYLYKFVVDGQWMTDPTNPHTTVIAENINSFLSLKPNYTFVLKGNNSAKTVRLAGNFNEWNFYGYTMAHNGDEWSISMRFKPGKVLYKYIVDGNWIIDPGNRQWEQNEFNTGNSVLWIGN
ncbi:glycogen-binding domain-containing protein [Mucilaginibacter galii]|uniref:AMP-activated protein kinase glycogen-binding domain-containing protein n=2 Tax=Mucilaginibacter galii TaxID=2005073 RepID=A0A917JA69_9SPHI|nr:hypothetical protein GCM10011425_15030 [Mucilaginibacter galii]